MVLLLCRILIAKKQGGGHEMLRVAPLNAICYGENTARFINPASDGRERSA